MVGPLRPVFKGKRDATRTRRRPDSSRPSTPQCCGVAAIGFRKHKRSFVMSKFMKAARHLATVGLLLVGFLACARLNRAEAGITNSVTFFNDTDVAVTPVID